MKKILIIEDNDDIREMTADILQLSNYQVFTAANGRLGVEKALEIKPDLVICDIMMPVLDGFGVLHIFHQNPDLQHIPFIFLTAKTERADFRKGMEMGADDYLTKPFQEIELLNAIESRFKRVEDFSKSVKATAESIDKFYDEAKAEKDLKNLSNDRKSTHLKKKQIIYFEGDTPLKCYFVKSGKVKTYQSNDFGKQFTTAFYDKGDFFGHLALIENTDYKETAEALEDSEIINIPKQDFLDLLFKNPQVSNRFIKLLANEITDREKVLSGMAYNSLRKRTADAPISLKNKYQSTDNQPFTMKISREDLASIVGTATESLIRTLSEFKTDKLIEVKGSEIKILNETKLAGLRG